MKYNWEDTLDELKAYINANPEIVIKRDAVTIPEDVKPGFYRLFDKIREEIVEAELGELIGRARVLSDNYIAARGAISRQGEERVSPKGKGILSRLFNRLRGKPKDNSFRFDEVVLDDNLEEFLSCPDKAMFRVLFEPLFNLLQEKVTLSAFKDIVKEKLSFTFRQLYHSGYEKWIILSLLKIMSIDAAYEVESHIITGREIIEQSRNEFEGVEKYPVSKNTNIFKSIPKMELVALSTTDIILKMTASENYLGIKSGFAQGEAYIAQESKTRKNIPFESVISFQKDAPLLIYKSNNPADVSLVADKNRFWRPDAIILCRENADLYTSEDRGKTKIIHDSLKPIIGTFVLKGPFAGGSEEYKQEDGISVLDIGFNPLTLKPVIERLSP